MIRVIAVSLLILLFAGKGSSQQVINAKLLPETCLTRTELELYKLINEYRATKGLPAIKLSTSLCFVARTHAEDQTENLKYSSHCNLHSWSDKGHWSPCCYTPDHKEAACMWGKPSELTNYQGRGYEISFSTTYKYDSPAAYAKEILEGWKHSSGHNSVITNQDIWKEVNWQAMGVGVYGEYSNVWFGEEIDTASELKVCE